MRLSSYTVPTQSLLVASYVDTYASAADYGVWDGLIGFALNKFPSGRKFDYILLLEANLYNNSFFQNLISADLSNNMLFGLRLSLSPDNKRQLVGGGDLTIGGLNASHFIGSLKWLDVVAMPFKPFKYFWSLNLTGFAATNINSRLPTSPAVFDSKSFAILDSGNIIIFILTLGASFVYMDRNSFNSFFLSDNFPVKVTLVRGLYTVPCNDISDLPVLSFYLNGTPFDLYRMFY